jgi:hypothetical protein
MPTPDLPPITIITERIVALLAKQPGSTAAEIAETLGLPVRPTEQHLTGLETTGTVGRAPGRRDGQRQLPNRWRLRRHAFTLDQELLAAFVAAMAEAYQVPADTLSLTDFSGEWLPEQLTDLAEHAQDPRYRVIATPNVGGVEVRIVAYPDDAGLILALRYDPLFFAHGAQISGGWDEPAAFIPTCADGADLDLANLEGILALLIDRANALLPVLRAALSA